MAKKSRKRRANHNNQTQSHGGRGSKLNLGHFKENSKEEVLLDKVEMGVKQRNKLFLVL